MDWIWFGLAGIISGIIAGMGMGGGTLLIPILTIFLSVTQHNAQGVNLVVFVPAAVVAIIIHAKNKLVNFSVGLPLIVGGAIAAILGSILAIHLSNDVLKKCFGVFLLLVGVWQIIYTILSVHYSKDNKVNYSNIKIVYDK